jgi:hypothetical protein
MTLITAVQTSPFEVLAVGAFPFAGKQLGFVPRRLQTVTRGAQSQSESQAQTNREEQDTKIMETSDIAVLPAVTKHIDVRV